MWQLKSGLTEQNCSYKIKRMTATTGTRKSPLFILTGFFSPFIYFLCFCLFSPFPSFAQDQSPQNRSQISFIKVHGLKLIDEDKKEFKIRGIVFNNNVWSNPDLPLLTHHNEDDFKRVKEMGFNTVRFYINYQLFESDKNPLKYKETGFRWLNQNIEWAKKNDIRLIFCMAVAPGHPGQSFAPEESFTLWNSAKEQRRLIALWREIATRYKKEPSVLGYSLLLYPNPKYKIEPWSKLAQKITHEIRLAESPQIVFARSANIRDIVIEYKSLDTGVYFPSTNDTLKNTVYEFPFYDPFEFCFQGIGIAGKKDFSLRYPNSEQVYAWGDVQWESTTGENPVYATKKESWQYLEGVPTLVNDPKLLFGYPTLLARKTGSKGIIWADAIEIKEYNKDKKYLRTIVTANTDPFEKWYFWKREGSGEGYIDSGIGYNSSSSLSIRETQSDATLSSPQLRFPLTQGHYYQISGYIKGKLLSTKCRAQLRIDFYSVKRGVYQFNKDYLKSRLNLYKNWSTRRNVPILLCEFGTGTPSFSADWGGLRWVNDILSLCKEEKIPFCYNSYRDPLFGLYTNTSTQLPEKSNQPLIKLFTSL